MRHGAALSAQRCLVAARPRAGAQGALLLRARRLLRLHMKSAWSPECEGEAAWDQAAPGHAALSMGLVTRGRGPGAQEGLAALGGRAWPQQVREGCARVLGSAHQVHVTHLLHGCQQLCLLRALQARLLRGQVRQTLAALALQTLAQLQALEGLQGHRLLQARQTLQGLRLLRRRRAERRLLLQALQTLQGLLLLRRHRAKCRLLLQALLLL